MKYRSNQYQSETSLLEMKESDIIGKYRGCQWNYKLPRHIPQLRPKLGLNYRGVSYSTCPNALPIMSGENLVTTIENYSNTSSKVYHYKLEDVHLQNLRRNLERRMKVAEENHNDYLLQMLRKESQELAMSN
ncbi:DUF4278 domain-containing protein [Geminocystis sp. NIES-3709]|uniref:DUF4278 domain-containing protein n=1 Tax=Geminocystis sp. NIES-3709 TaxID=1617448 RepID=UPI001E33DC20|nr:DUF4278 domain-containing protein [Geminocystis sp. NIES-3709]